MHVIITGVSGGLGLALVEKFLARGNKVTGIGRKNQIDHSNYTFISCDFRDLSQVQEIQLELDHQPVILINNAGIIGNISRLSDQDQTDVEEVFKVNTLTPMLLSAKLMRSTSHETPVTIVNISSGAGRRSIPSWAAYCASKAAIDRFSETFYLEELEKGRKIRVYSVAPGVIDTAMQRTIRSTAPSDFSSIDRFLELKSDNNLKSPEETAEQILELIHHADFDASNIICSL